MNATGFCKLGAYSGMGSHSSQYDGGMSSTAKLMPKPWSFPLRSCLEGWVTRGSGCGRKAGKVEPSQGVALGIPR